MAQAYAYADERIYYFLIFFAQKESPEKSNYEKSHRHDTQPAAVAKTTTTAVCGSQLAVRVCVCVCCALADAKEIWRQFYAQAARTKKVKPMGEG